MAFMRGSHEGSLNAPRLKMADAECIREVTEQVVKEAAQCGGCVIVGPRFGLLPQNRRDAFHIFIYAPFDEKVRRLRAEGKSEHEAIHLAESVDRDREAFIRQYFGVDWPDRHRFHLMVNSAIGEDAAVETILNSMGAVEAGSICTFARQSVALDRRGELTAIRDAICPDACPDCHVSQSGRLNPI